MASRPEKLLLLDTASLYFRAFYGVPDKVKADDGTSVNAVRGLLDIIAKLVTTYEPTRLVACWDDDWRPGWRVDLLPTYKAHRVVQTVDGAPDVEEVPPALTAQIPLIRETLETLGISIVGAADHEADDVIGTLATHADAPVDIVTGDRDLFQLVDDERAVRVIYTARGMSNLEIIDDAAVQARYGIRASQYADFAALRGDPSDGLPGVPGIGEKSAAALLAASGDLGGIRAAAADGTAGTPAQRAKILAAGEYLDVAPTVVRVARDLDLVPTDDRILVDDARAEAAAKWAERWNLGTSMTRAVAALRR
ncbi:5'-3' exonuclease [Microbacterium sp. 1P10AE]|uniref:5'-3' exonuclease n=1 Tax=Microbacterium sp. 1P10AE TaxID=3132286 RepID=UPI00399F4AEE